MTCRLALVGEGFAAIGQNGDGGVLRTLSTIPSCAFVRCKEGKAKGLPTTAPLRTSLEQPFSTLQVYRTSSPIASGRASKIPPIYERPTTSNISFEEGGVFNVTKPCNRQPHLLSVSRGVRSRPLEETVTTTTKVETVPLLSPTMESDLLKEPWVFPQPKASLLREEDNSTALSVWEENFQDLSVWCMDAFQGQCDFHIGESTNYKLSGTNYEGNSVLSSEEGVFKELTDVAEEEKWSIKMNSTGMSNASSASCRGVESTAVAATRYAKEDNSTDTIASNSWEKLPRETTADLAQPSWNKQHGTDLNTAFHTKYCAEDVDMDEACPTSFDSNEHQRETWDMLRTIETTGSDTFDLLSYLCDDELRSPEGSVSDASSTVSRVKPASKPKLAAIETGIQVKVENGTVRRPKMESRATSTVTSSSLEGSAVSVKRVERTRASFASGKIEKTYARSKREKQSRKRYIESDSDDDRSSVSQYRESREKNNEASRKSRMNKKAKENEMSTRATELERDNRILKMKVEELEKLVTSMRSALLRSALKKEF